MATPLRKDKEELTTADLAQSQSAAPEVKGPKPVAAERNVEQGARTSAEEGRAEESIPLFPNTELEGLRTRWKEVQIAFVDEPRKAVEQADSLVASAMKRLAEVFTEERSKLEHQWDRGDSVSTEDLRVALQRYRTFFHRLLSV
jgi:hypothetical protein